MKDRSAIWPGEVAFREPVRAELVTLGLSDRTIATIEWGVAYVASYYATNPPDRRARRDMSADAQRKLAVAAEALAVLDAEIVDSIEALAYRQAAKTPLAELKELLDAYAAASGQLAKIAEQTPQRGPDATKDTHLAVWIGSTLRSAGMQIDDSTRGPFVRAAAAAFSAAGIHKADVRNDVRRALQILEREHWLVSSETTQKVT